MGKLEKKENLKRWSVFHRTAGKNTILQSSWGLGFRHRPDLPTAVDNFADFEQKYGFHAYVFGGSLNLTIMSGRILGVLDR